VCHRRQVTKWHIQVCQLCVTGGRSQNGTYKCVSCVSQEAGHKMVHTSVSVVCHRRQVTKSRNGSRQQNEVKYLLTFQIPKLIFFKHSSILGCDTVNGLLFSDISKECSTSDYSSWTPAGKDTLSL